MEVHLNATLGYAFGLGGLLILITLRSFIQAVIEFLFPRVLIIWKIPLFLRLARRTSNWVLKHLIYRSLFRHGSNLDTCNRFHTILFVLYVSVNLSCILVQAASVAEVCSRAGTLAVINMLLLYAGPCLNFVADMLRVPLRIHHQVHASAGYMVGILTSVHAVGAFVSKGGFAVNHISDLLAVLAMSGICLLLMPVSLFSRVLPYELLLFMHRTLSILLGYAIWRHLPSEHAFPRLYLYSIAGIFLFALVLQIAIALYRSRCWFHSARFAYRQGVIQVTIYLRKPLKVEPGQYINLWTPSSLLSTLQIHPLSVASWSPKPQEILVLFAQIREGFTRSLLQQVRYGDTTSIAMFTGPHGLSLPVDKYDQVLLIATGLGIVALLPYLQWLAYAAHARETRTQSVHLIWYLNCWELLLLVPDLLNAALEEDEPKETEDSTILNQKHVNIIKISIYGEKFGHLTRDITYALETLEKSKRVQICREPMDLSSILDKEIVTSRANDNSGKPCAIAASVWRTFRDELTAIARTKLRDVDLMYTEYQP